MADIGLDVLDLRAGHASMRLPDRPDWLGDPARGLLHPGPLIVLADSCCGMAVVSAQTERKPVATLDLRMDYLRRAGPGHDLFGETECYRMTANVAFVRGTVWQHDRTQPVASVHATFMQATPVRRAPAEPQPPEQATWVAPTGADAALDGVDIPYASYLGIELAQGGASPIYRMPYQRKLIGNPLMPALHGGVVAGFSETAATLHLIRAVGGAKFPKCIDFSIDYVRSGRPEATYASCEIVRLGGRVAMVQVNCWQGKGPDAPITVARGQFLLTDSELAA
jgi:uncharacterized protein (TIGR00369 family)